MTMILLFVLALLAPLTTSESEGWTHLVGDSATIYPFNPLTSNIEYKIIPLEENLANYGFSLTSRLFGDSGKLKGSVAYIVQMNGGKKNWMKVGARNVQGAMKFCFDKATMAGEGLPEQVVHDTNEGSLVSLDDKVANFATKACNNMRFFSAMLQENAITRVQPTVFDLVGNMDSKVEVYFKIVSLVEPTEPAPQTTETPEIDNLVAPDPVTETEMKENEKLEDVVSESGELEPQEEPVPEEPEVEEPVPEVEESVPEVEEPVPEVEEPVPEVEETVPELEETVPEVEESVPEVEESVPEVEEPVPEEHVVEETVPEEPEVEESVPEVEETVPEEPEVEDTVPEAEETVPEVEETVPEVEKSVPEVEETVPEVEESVPEVEESVPEVEEPVPEDPVVEEAVPEEPEVEESVPEVEETVPEVEETVPEVEETVPEVEESVPEVEETVPEVEETVPEFEEPVPVVEEPVPEVEETVPEEPEVDETVPEVEETVPEEPVPENTVPENTVPEETVPEETVPAETVPEEPVVEEAGGAFLEESDVAVPEETESKNEEEDVEEEVAPITFTGDVCSIFPQGIISTFADESNLYDLSCSHVLAASIGNNGRGADWFIYGTFDQFDGMSSLSSITMYMGYEVFEIQRGWTINNHGEKFRIMEGEQAELHGCTFFFEGLHISVDCQASGFPVRVVYDGYSVGFVEVFAEGAYDIGLCHSNSEGSRPNWQVNSGREGCDISPDLAPCPISAPECESASCDPGLVAACNELHCMGAPSDEVLCSLALANQLVCGDEGAWAGECPADTCWRKFFVLGAGCPQAPFFTGCPMDEYL